MGGYIPPEDSLYYDAAMFGYIQSFVQKDEMETFFIMGDLNSRVGVPRETYVKQEKIIYSGCEDTHVNANGRRILQLCDYTNLAIINNLEFRNKHFKSRLSFRKKHKWISEPDLLIASTKGIDLIETFYMIRLYEGNLLYSDHALLEFEINMEKVRIFTEVLKIKANNLGVGIRNTKNKN